MDLYAYDEEKRGRYFLLCGGEYDPGMNAGNDIILDSAWVYNATNNSLTDVGPMINAHDEFAAVPLGEQSGFVRALIIAGYGRGDSYQANCEIYLAKSEFFP